MTSTPLALQRSALVTSVGLDGPSSCAAIRAKLTNPFETRFADPQGEWVMVHQVPLQVSWRGLPRLAQLASMAIAESLADVPLGN